MVHLLGLRTENHFHSSTDQPALPDITRLCRARETQAERSERARLQVRVQEAARTLPGLLARLDVVDLGALLIKKAVLRVVAE